jgi:hypothetical protein
VNGERSGLVGNVSWASGTCLRIGLVGHRELGDAEQGAAVRRKANQYFRHWCTAYGYIQVCSALAVGADTLLAQAALHYHCHLVVVEPFARYESEFDTHELARYRRLRARAEEVIHLPPPRRSREALRRAGEWIVDHTDILLAVWDGQPARSEGGTGDTVAYAFSNGRAVVQILLPRQAPAGSPAVP